VSLGTFQAAADHLNVTQPTISLRIRELESIIGYPLLRRNGGRGELTPEGSMFYQYVERLVGTLDEMDQRMRTQDPLQGVLRLGCSDIFSMSCLPELLSRLEKIYPGLRVELTIRDSPGLAELLNGKLIDMAFMAEGPVAQNVRIYPLAYFKLGWFGPADRRSGGAAMTAAELAAQRLMTLPANRILNSIMLNWFEESNQHIPPVSTCNSLAMILRLTNSGHTWSILPFCFTQLSEGCSLSPLIRMPPELPTLKLCSAFQSEASANTLAPVLAMARDIIVGKPGVQPIAA
jgi:DNA-binding transcriptional LysR family regulator